MNREESRTKHKRERRLMKRLGSTNVQNSNGPFAAMELPWTRCWYGDRPRHKRNNRMYPLFYFNF